MNVIMFNIQEINEKLTRERPISVCKAVSRHDSIRDGDTGMP